MKIILIFHKFLFKMYVGSQEYYTYVYVYKYESFPIKKVSIKFPPCKEDKAITLQEYYSACLHNAPRTLYSLRGAAHATHTAMTYACMHAVIFAYEVFITFIEIYTIQCDILRISIFSIFVFWVSTHYFLNCISTLRNVSECLLFRVGTLYDFFYVCFLCNYLII